MRETYDHDGARPWRGVKRDNWEGGHRVPLIVRWPGVVEPGRETAQTVSLTDLMATVAEIIGRELPEDAGRTASACCRCSPVGRRNPSPCARTPCKSRSGGFPFVSVRGSISIIGAPVATTTRWMATGERSGSPCRTAPRKRPDNSIISNAIPASGRICISSIRKWSNVSRRTAADEADRSQRPVLATTNRVVFRSEAVKKWDWLRAETAKTLENQRLRRCLSQFFHSLSAKVRAFAERKTTFIPKASRWKTLSPKTTPDPFRKTRH
jgi:hypothetical protein